MMSHSISLTRRKGGDGSRFIEIETRTTYDLWLQLCGVLYMQVGLGLVNTHGIRIMRAGFVRYIRIGRYP